ACGGTDLLLHPERRSHEAQEVSALPLRPGLSHPGRSGKLQVMLEEAEDEGCCAIDIVDLVEQKAFHREENAFACAHKRKERFVSGEDGSCGKGRCPPKRRKQERQGQAQKE